MDDQQIVAEIDRLAQEEHHLEREHIGRPLSEDEAERLRQVEVALDLCYDLLRQRRARRNSGADPDQATVRPAGTVEGYEQ